MDLYEALTKGTSPEELISTFNKDLEAAKARYAAETAASKKLDEKREKLAAALEEYVTALFGDKYQEIKDEGLYGPDDTIEYLKTYEKDMAKLLNLDIEVKKIFDKKGKKPIGMEFKAKTPGWKDDDIINAFLKSLK